MGSSPSKNPKEEGEKKPAYKQPWFWPVISIFIVSFVFLIVALAYQSYFYRDRGIKDYELILKHKDELMDLYEQYWGVTEKMKKVLQNEANTMTLDDLLNYLRRIETGKVCRNNSYRSRIPELEKYCSSLKQVFGHY